MTIEEETKWELAACCSSSLPPIMIFYSWTSPWNGFIFGPIRVPDFLWPTNDNELSYSTHRLSPRMTCYLPWHEMEDFPPVAQKTFLGRTKNPTASFGWPWNLGQDIPHYLRWDRRQQRRRKITLSNVRLFLSESPSLSHDERTKIM